MSQQTAIEWYDQALRKCLMGTVECDPDQILKEANQMFEKQIVKAVDSNFSYDSTEFPTLGQQYYDNTYKK